MQIIIKTDLNTNREEVINVIYGENSVYVNNWINSFFEKEISSLKMSPNDNKFIQHDSLDYFVEIENNIYYLVKKYKLISKGYIYNSYEKKAERLYSIKVINYENIENIVLNETPCETLWNDINLEIIHRIMKQIDKDSLLQLNLKFESAIKTKKQWSSTEIIMLQYELIKTHKKELYSSIVKKMKKIEKKQQNKNTFNQIAQLPCKTIILDENGLNGFGGIMPNLTKHACSLEYHIINKDKFE